MSEENNAANGTEGTGAEETGKASETKSLRPRKLIKEIQGTKLIITEGVSKTTMTYDFASLPAEIQAKLGPYGLSQKLGDSAAGKQGTEAVEAIETVWKGLLENNWTVRAPAGEKVSKNDILEKIKAMPEGKEKKASYDLAVKLGLIPAGATL